MNPDDATIRLKCSESSTELVYNVTKSILAGVVILMIVGSGITIASVAEKASVENQSDIHDQSVATGHGDYFGNIAESIDYFFAKNTNSRSNSQSNQQSWQTISGEHFVVEYRDGYKSDAQQIHDWMNRTRSQTYEVIPSDTAVTLNHRIHVRVYPGSEWTRSDHSLYWQNTEPVRIHVQAPTDSSVNRDWYDHGLAHEYLNIVLWDYVEDNADYSYWGRNPSWFAEGISEYYAYRLDAVRDQYPPRDISNMNESIKDGDGYFDIMASNTYDGGHLLAQYMFSRYNNTAVVSILAQDTDSFPAAVERNLNTDYVEFKRGWLRWAEEHIGGDYEVEDRSNSTTVNINVTVAPGGNTTTFQAGSNALASVSRENADVRNVNMYYSGETFTPNGSGIATIPLTSPGQANLTVSFQNTSTKATFPVEQQMENESDATTAPTAAFNVAPMEPTSGESIVFDASESDDSDGNIQTHEWDFDSDGSYEATGEKVSKTFSAVGEFTVTLRVVDSDGASDTTGQTITMAQESSQYFSGIVAQYNTNGDDEISLSELGDAAADYAGGDLTIAEIGDVASAYSSS